MAWHATWCSDRRAFALLERMWADGNSSSLALAGKAARVAVLANTRHGRLLSVTATHRLCRDSLRALDGVALEASSA